MTQHIIDADELEKLHTDIFDDMQWVRVADLRKLIANSPQADGMANSRDMFEQFATLHNMPVLKVGEAYSNDDTNYAWWVWKKSLSTTAQVDGRMVNADALIKAFENDIAKYDNIPNLHSAIAIVKAMLSAYKPQADDVRKDAEREWIPKFPVGSKVVFYQKHPESPLDQEPRFGTVESYYDWNTAECGEHYTIKMAVVDVDGVKIKVEHNCLLSIDKARE